MRVFSIVWTKLAEDELDDIYDYIEQDTQDPIVASAQVNRILDLIDKLSCMPEKFRRVSVEPLRSLGWHIVTVNRYSILYRVHADRDVVVIMNILHCRQDIDAYLRNVPLHDDPPTP